MKVVIVGGVAAGAGAAARLRRLDERAEIVMLERGEYISFANCGLPYHLGEAIPDRDDLLVMPAAKFRAWFNVDVRTGSEVIALDRDGKRVAVRRADGSVYHESYDKLLLATGSSPLTLPIPGGDDPRVLRLWTLPDMDKIKALVDSGARRALVVGGGFIGLETAENLRERGLDVTIIQHSAHVLSTLDGEMAVLLHQELERLGIGLRTRTELVSLLPDGQGLLATLDNGSTLQTDMVIMSVGIRPNTGLAEAAGLELGYRQHIRVNARLQTSDPDIYAAGDAIEVLDPVSGHPTAIPLAGPANKQGRIAADNMAGRDSRYRGTYGASIIKVGALTAASIGHNEKQLRAAGLPFHKIYTHPGSNAGYYPTATQIHIKLLFAPDGTILGAQIIGERGVDKRLDTLAVAMACGRPAPELAELEFAYAPPYNSAKDPVNFLGMMAGNVLAGDTTLAYAEALPAGGQIVDVREPGEHARGAIPGAVNIPLGQLRARLAELDRTRPVIVSCQVGLRGYLAERILKQNGFSASNLSGGYRTWQMVRQAAATPTSYDCCGRPRKTGV